jgi:ectoine hydroxylase-related dioxygenase (phytanoyl-CoA dioxygenase family)
MKCGTETMVDNSDLTNDGRGYTVIEDLISDELINSIRSKLPTLRPVRASSNDKTYAERLVVHTLPDIAVWWSQLVSDWPEVQEIDAEISPMVELYLPTAEFYCADIVTINPGSKWINPHVDTPHRFQKYNYDKRLLGIQCIVALEYMDQSNGATGLVVASHKTDHNINLCYQGYYDHDFKNQCIQPELHRGDVLMYNCRLMHSSMPNPSNKARPALLINYLERDIIDEIKSIDNIWTSNA